MLQIITGFGPEIPRLAYEVSDRLESDLKGKIPRELSVSLRFGVIILNFISIDPKSGRIPNDVKWMRLRRELWTTWNFDFDEFVVASAPEMRAMMKRGAVDALTAVPAKLLDSEKLAKMLRIIEASI